MTKNVSVDTKSAQETEKDEKEKNINEEKNKEYEAMLERVRTFELFQDMKKKIKEMEKHEEEYDNMEKKYEKEHIAKRKKNTYWGCVQDFK